MGFLTKTPQQHLRRNGKPKNFVTLNHQINLTAILPPFNGGVMWQMETISCSICNNIYWITMVYGHPHIECHLK